MIDSLEYGKSVTLKDTRLSFHPAGHILGSAQIRIEGRTGVWVVAGDYKRAADPTCAGFEVVPCDTFVSESTFALPIYRWDSTDSVITEILAWGTSIANAADSTIFCYTIGKAQRRLPSYAPSHRSNGAGARLMVPMIRSLSRQRCHAGRANVIERPRGTSLAGELVMAPRQHAASHGCGASAHLRCLRPA